jgi:hypothetical protein
MVITKYSLSDIPGGSSLEEDLLNELKMGGLPKIAKLSEPDEIVEVDFSETPVEEWVAWAIEKGVDLSQYRDDSLAEPWRVIDRTMNPLNAALDKMAEIPDVLDLTPQERHQLKDLCAGLVSLHDKLRNFFLSLEWLDDETKEQLDIFMD